MHIAVRKVHRVHSRILMNSFTNFQKLYKVNVLYMCGMGLLGWVQLGWDAFCFQIKWNELK